MERNIIVTFDANVTELFKAMGRRTDPLIPPSEIPEGRHRSASLVRFSENILIKDDRQINPLVYELYALIEEEIKIVEGDR